jgi:NAD(P)H dehydrogenase (quinone)
MPELSLTPVNVMVVFYSRYGDTERLALAAGLGAVEARANIRLRRLKDLADAATIERDPRWTENLQRMLADYIPPREIDADWADVILVASSPDSPAEAEQYLKALITGVHKDLKIVLVRDDPGDRTTSARAQGKQAVEAARLRKALSQ